MWVNLSAASDQPSKAKKSLLRRWQRDARGTTAIEFALVGPPFLMFCLAIMAYGLYFFTTTALEFATETASRKIRTGQAQTAALSRDQFRQEICNAAGTIIDCSPTKLKVHIQSAGSWAGITPTPCLASDALSSSAGSGSDAVSLASGGARQAVVITVCYEWTLAQALPFLLLSNMNSGSSVIQAVTSFRTEPYQ